ncbi:SAM-dependent DNA methyltransferase [Streptomyces sp. Go40/10]|uniref:Eco57I restriction-modification methylase domain-containing protein n=1 Tax=Streptomyces sp. Go40/10 TaxID=2825844 RepID=UPI001E5F082F|nr:DNA methyltransferase [Streptomyces sp. Go40/10]UFR01768.1 SAM-dependent DNA methyltransferase [Streptomyces sp. Go40/10]
MSATTRNQVFTAVHTVGGLLPADMLLRVSEGRDVPGSRPADYGLPSSRSVRDEAERSWEYLKPLWRELRERLPEDPDTGVPAADPTGIAQSDWLTPLWRELGFGRLTPVGQAGITADSDPGKTFPVSHRWGHTLIHQTPWNTEPDRRPGGAGTVPPQSMLQECLNRTEAHLWGVLTNGRRLRLLRDSSALATASYVEFDLEAIFDGELFSEFTLLYRLLHASRFEVAEGAAAGCRLEQWRTEAIASGTRALDQLRRGVQEAITTLGTGFLRHPDNAALRENLDVRALHTALLRLAYRLLFVFVAEDRDVLHGPGASERARERYARYFSSARLRAHARRRRGTSHGDLYQSLRIVLDALGDEHGRPELGLPGLGGIFTDTEADAPLHGLSLANEYLLTAVRHLSQVRDNGSRRRRAIDYRHLDAEELGSVYESLLELVPQHSAAERTFELVELVGNTRKTTGSYYTPSGLIERLLDTTLDPVLDDAVKRGEAAASAAGAADATDAIVRELLSLTVCDPACGSGHFLVAAARRIAKRVAAVRERLPEPPVEAVRHALHEVVARCVYGVDLNPMAVELAKVSLWLEALEPGRPLGFLDAHIKHGNALVGATPALLGNGVPDEAFKPIEGDDKKYAKALEKQNRRERAGQGGLFDLDTETKVANAAFASRLRRITAAGSDTLAEVRRQEAAYLDWSRSAEYTHALHVADAWCAAFVWPKRPGAPLAVTQDVFRSLQDPSADAAPRSTHEEIRRLRDQYAFFHWHLEFPEVFSVPEASAATGGLDPATGWAGGFDCVVGNPPWERIKLQEQEFFAQRDPAIANAGNAAARKKLISGLRDTRDGHVLYAEYEAAKRRSEGESHFLRDAGRCPLTGRGDINTYAVFSETDRLLTSPHGRMGVIVPTGIATDATTQYFFKDLVRTGALAALYDFENAAPLFPNVHRSFKFSILSLTGRAAREPKAEFAFFLHSPQELDEPGKSFTLTPKEITLLNPNTGTCPVFRSRRDAEITLGVYRRVPVLVDEGAPGGNPWGFQYTEVLHLSHAAGELLDSEPDQGAAYKVYEAKMLHHYDHRWFTYADEDTVVRTDPAAEARPRYWVRRGVVDDRLAGRWDADWMLGWRDICRSTDERTVIAALLPRAALANTLPLASLADPGHAPLLVAALSSFALDYVARQKVAGTHLTMIYLRQLPVPSARTLAAHGAYVRPRVLELVHTAADMAPFARDLGDGGPPFRWDEARRQVIRAELDALFFHLYGISREDVVHVLDTFPIVKRKDEARYGTYHTKELILGEYDRMAEAGLTPDNPLVDGDTYTSTLTPPPGHGPRHALPAT